jgi:hypothetical protein
LPGWQRFYAAHRSESFELVSIALEHLGAVAARPFVAAAGAEFPTLVDERGLTGERFGFKVVPNGVLVDEAGVVRYAKFGGFSIDNQDDVAAVERFLTGADPGASPTPEVPYELAPEAREQVAAKLRLGQRLDEAGRRLEAVAAWREALRLDPENLTIRKQIWAAEHPERFHPEIDFGWQQGQLREERAAEVAAGICGPDGCPVPWQAARGPAA